MKTVVICGPMACGKTRNSGHLMDMFEALGVVDDWNPRRHHVEPGCIHLTSHSIGEVDGAGVRCRIVRFADLELPAEAKKADPGAFRDPSDKRFPLPSRRKPFHLEEEAPAA